MTGSVGQGECNNFHNADLFLSAELDNVEHQFVGPGLIDMALHVCEEFLSVLEHSDIDVTVETHPTVEEQQWAEFLQDYYLVVQCVCFLGASWVCKFNSVSNSSTVLTVQVSLSNEHRSLKTLVMDLKVEGEDSVQHVTTLRNCFIIFISYFCLHHEHTVYLLT